MRTKISLWCAAVLLTAVCTGNLNAETVKLAQGRAAIFYFSETGNTRSVCEVLGREIPADLIELKVVKESAAKGELPVVEPGRVDLKPYRLIVVASPVWMGNLVPAVQAFLNDNRLGSLQVAVVTTANVPMPAEFQAKHKNLVTEAGGVVSGYYQVAVQEKKEGKGGKGVPRTKEALRNDAKDIAAEIMKIMAR